MGQFTQGKRPSPTAIKEAVAYLETLGLTVYGGFVDLTDGEQGPGCRDYDAEQILQLRKLHENDLVWRPE